MLQGACSHRTSPIFPPVEPRAILTLHTAEAEAEAVADGDGNGNGGMGDAKDSAMIERTLDTC